MDCRLPGSSVHNTSQGSILPSTEELQTQESNRPVPFITEQPSEVKWSESRSVVYNSLRSQGLYSPWNSPVQNTGVSSLSLLQGIFPTQASNQGLLHCRQILYQLNHQGSPRILEWAAYPFSSGFSQPRNQPGSPALQAIVLPTELSGHHETPKFTNLEFYNFKPW